MKRVATAVVILLLTCAGFPLAAQPGVGERPEITVFSLGHSGWDLPPEALVSVDYRIEEAFAESGRFQVTGLPRRLSSGGLERLESALGQSGARAFAVTGGYLFDDTWLTGAEFERLARASVVVVPVVTRFVSYYNDRTSRHETTMATEFTFIDVAAGGKVSAVVRIDTSGADGKNRGKSISSAMNAIPGQLRAKMKSLPGFQVPARLLFVSGSTVRLQPGRDMDLNQGDEYTIYGDSGGDSGLIVITEVGPGSSSGEVLYTEIPLDSGTRLREVKRLGLDFDFHFHVASGGTFGALLPGFNLTAVRGFHPLRPWLCFDFPISAAFAASPSGVVGPAGTVVPLTLVVGGEYLLNFGRLSFAPRAGAGLTFLHSGNGLVGYPAQKNLVSHAGFQVYWRLAYLLTPNSRLFVDAGIDKWYGIDRFGLFAGRDFGGTCIGAGFALKL